MAVVMPRRGFLRLAGVPTAVAAAPALAGCAGIQLMPRFVTHEDGVWDRISYTGQVLTDETKAAIAAATKQDYTKAKASLQNSLFEEEQEQGLIKRIGTFDAPGVGQYCMWVHTTARSDLASLDNKEDDFMHFAQDQVTPAVANTTRILQGPLSSLDVVLKPRQSDQVDTISSARYLSHVIDLNTKRWVERFLAGEKKQVLLGVSANHEFFHVLNYVTDNYHVAQRQLGNPHKPLRRSKFLRELSAVVWEAYSLQRIQNQALLPSNVFVGAAKSAELLKKEGKSLADKVYNHNGSSHHAQTTRCLGHYLAYRVLNSGLEQSGYDEALRTKDKKAILTAYSKAVDDFELYCTALLHLHVPNIDAFNKLNEQFGLRKKSEILTYAKLLEGAQAMQDRLPT